MSVHCTVSSTTYKIRGIASYFCSDTETYFRLRLFHQIAYTRRVEKNVSELRVHLETAFRYDSFNHSIFHGTAFSVLKTVIFFLCRNTFFLTHLYFLSHSFLFSFHSYESNSYLCVDTLLILFFFRDFYESRTFSRVFFLI